MQGKVLDFNLQQGEGIIIAENGERYTFKSADWKSSDVHPSKNVEVDFAPEGTNATAIYTISVSAAGASSDATIAKFIYIGYLAGLIIPFVSIIGLIIAYVYKKDEPQWLETHFRFQIRTFWISMLYFFISFLLFFVLIGYITIIVALVWYVIRCIKGLQALNNQQPVANVTRWGF